MICIYSSLGGKAATLTAALGLLGMAVAGQADASCMGNTQSPTHDSSVMRLAPAIYRSGAVEGASGCGNLSSRALARITVRKPGIQTAQN
jgi:hypothetical protein